MINMFGWKRGCVGRVSLHQQKPSAQCHFDILLQLRSATVHSKNNQPKGSVVFTRLEGVLTIGGMGR